MISYRDEQAKITKQVVLCLIASCVCVIPRPSKFSFTCINLFLVEILQTATEPREDQHSCLSCNCLIIEHTVFSVEPATGRIGVT